MSTVTTILITVLTWSAFAAVIFYRQARDRHLNYRAGHDFRVWIMHNVAPVLQDPGATPRALSYADALLSFVYDRRRLREMSRQPSPPQPAPFPVEALGRHAGLLLEAVKYVAILTALENRATGTGMRKFLAAADCTPIDAVNQLPLDHEEDALPASLVARASEAADGFTHFPRGKEYEHVVEDRLMAFAG